MLELQEISLALGAEPAEQILLHEVSAYFPAGHFSAIIGPSGCGKSTLLKVIAGIREPTSGSVHWSGRDLAREGDLAPHEIGYVPQFSIAYDYLTVWESVETALQLRVRNLDGEERHRRAEALLRAVGLYEIADRQVRVLSGGQKRRLPLAMEMVSSPALLLVDEVTSGLDPKSEDEIVRLMKQLAADDSRIVLSVTHSLRHVPLYDSVLVLADGHLAYHGPGELLYHYFNVENAEGLFPRLAERPGSIWHRSWVKHRAVYLAELEKLHPAQDAASPVEESPPVDIKSEEAPFNEEEQSPAVASEQLIKSSQQMKSSQLMQSASPLRDDRAAIGDLVTPQSGLQTGRPGALPQLLVLLERRWKIFFRDRGQIWLQLALMFGFPCLVVIFAWDGLTPMQNLAMGSQQNFVQQLLADTEFLVRSLRVGGLVSGLVMLQVILLTLTGSNNSAREIAAERLIFEKEKFGGLRPSSYVLSKALFLAALVLAQSVWMALFVKVICRMPGDLLPQIALLTLVNGAMTAVCLGISSLTKTPEQASLVSFYLVGFQLPLSGAVLAMPQILGWITRPFIASYWSWSGYLQTMRDTRFYEAVQKVTQTELSSLALCLVVLCAHIVIGLFLAYSGCKSSRWE